MIYFFMASLIESLSNLRAMSLRAFIETSLILGTVDEHTLKIEFIHLSTNFYPKWQRAIYLNEYIAAILK